MFPKNWLKVIPRFFFSWPWQLAVQKWFEMMSFIFKHCSIGMLHTTTVIFFTRFLHEWCDESPMKRGLLTLFLYWFAMKFQNNIMFFSLKWFFLYKWALSIFCSNKSNRFLEIFFILDTRNLKMVKLWLLKKNWVE